MVCVEGNVKRGKMFFDCRNVSYQYPGTSTPVFHDLSFKIETPGFHALFGPSGVGKTSFAKILSGQIGGFNGQVGELRGPVLYSYNLERLPGWSSVGTHLEKITPDSRNELKEELIEVFGLGEYMGMRFSQLSLGQKNRINLLRYLLQDFSTLIMDESLANVDEPTRGAIILKMKSIFKDVCFLYISHNVVEVATFCDRILVFRGAHKTPQTQMVRGCNHTTDESLSSGDVNRGMLEIMNAS